MAVSAVDRKKVAVFDSLRFEKPLPSNLGTCVLVHDFLSPSECAALIERAERQGFASADSDYPPSYRNNDRQVEDDPEFARMLFARMRGLVPETIQDRDSADSVTTWHLQALNERLRWCRYGPDQRFNIHQDGVHHRGANCRSRLTFMIYLSGPEAFDGGDTLFYASGPRADGEFGAPPVIARARPRVGSLIIFDHSIWHAGDTVTRGVKHILRSDLLYSCRVRFPVSPEVPFSLGHQGYVWTLAKLADGRIASAGRDASIRLWSDDGKLVGRLDGHHRSVLGLSEIAPNILASVSRDRRIRVWDLKRLTCLREVAREPAAVLSIAKLGEGAFATGSADSTIALRDSSGAALHRLIGHAGWVWALARCDADTLASASEDGSIRLWDVDQRICVAELPGSQPLRTIDVQASGTHDDAERLLATGDVSGRVCIWSATRRNPSLVAQFHAHDAAIRRVRFLSDGRLATCGEDQRLRTWSVSGQRLLFECSRPNFVTDVVEIQGDKLLCSGYDGRLALIENRNGFRLTGEIESRSATIEPFIEIDHQPTVK